MSNEETLRSIIEEECQKVLAALNMTPEQMWETSMRLAEISMSAESKLMLSSVKADAAKGTPDDLEKMYYQIFVAGYSCGQADEQKKNGW